VSVSQVQQQAQAQAQLLVPPSEGRGGLNALAKMPVVQLLRLFGVRDPLRYADFPKERVLQVVAAGRAKKRKNLGGWIATALSRNWDLSAYNEEVVEVTN